MSSDKSVSCKCGKSYLVGTVAAKDKTIHTIDGWTIQFLGKYVSDKLVGLNGCPECLPPERTGRA